jgi:hypothetical protein
MPVSFGKVSSKKDQEKMLVDAVCSKCGERIGVQAIPPFEFYCSKCKRWTVVKKTENFTWRNKLNRGE